MSAVPGIVTGGCVQRVYIRKQEVLRVRNADPEYCVIWD